VDELTRGSRRWETVFTPRRYCGWPSAIRW